MFTRGYVSNLSISRRISLAPMIASNEVTGGSSSSSGIVENATAENVAPSNAPFDPEALKRLVDVRTKILRGGIYGMALGCGVGTVIHITIDKFIMRTGIAKRISLKYPYLRIPHKFPKNSLIPTILCFGAAFSFASSSVSGRNEFNTIGDIWSINAKSKSNYQNQMNQNKYDLHTEQDEAFERRTAQIKESKAIKEELEKWGPPKV